MRAGIATDIQREDGMNESNRHKLSTRCDLLAALSHGIMCARKQSIEQINPRGHFMLHLMPIADS